MHRRLYYHHSKNSDKSYYPASSIFNIESIGILSACLILMDCEAIKLRAYSMILTPGFFINGTKIEN